MQFNELVTANSYYKAEPGILRCTLESVIQSTSSLEFAH